MSVHIGHIIEAEFRRQGRQVQCLAQKLSCNRATVYNIFRCPSVDTARLLQISRLFGHDFFQYYSQELSESETTVILR
ncbi:MAG: XRE family transcriptional regulator [Paludibacteraceae bacterium]|nr:XRE family transcriptional regulator [Paludibacteraceae bacterium]